jgi:outer membrane protein
MKCQPSLALPLAALAVVHASVPQASADSPASVAAPLAVQGAEAPPGLEQYEQQALASNLALSERRLTVERRAIEQQAARAGYYPSIDLGLRYSYPVLGGLDLGDLINPAYDALNQLIGTKQFPTDLKLLLPLALQASVGLRQPIYVPALPVANKLASLSHKASQVELEITRREIIAAVRVAYLGHARAAQVGALLVSTRSLLEENLRVSQQLVAADKQTRDVVFRATAELAAHDQLIRQVLEARRSAGRALNQLRGATLEERVQAPSQLSIPAAMPVALATLLQRAQTTRTELRLLGVGRSVAETERELIHASSLPTVALALDYGVQSADLSPTLDDDFATLSLVASWNVFDGGKDRKLRRAKGLEVSATEVRRRQLIDQIESEVRNAYGAAEVALAAVTAAAQRVQSAQSVYDIVTKKYAVGALPQIEEIAARTTLLQAGTDQITAATDFHLRLVELERVTESKENLR